MGVKLLLKEVNDMLNFMDLRKLFITMVMSLVLMIVLMSAFAINSFAGFEGLQDGDSLKIFNRISCNTGLTCARGKNGLFNMQTSPSAPPADQTEGLNTGRLAIFDYDFDVDGGSIGAITTGVNLPAKAVIEKCFFRVETQLVDAGAGTLAVSCEDADNILTAADQTGVADGVFLASNITGTAANMVDDIAATCNLTYTIGGAALSAGKIRGYCRYSIHP